MPSSAAPSIKTAVIALRTQGRSIRKIAKEVGLAYNTTKRILREENVDASLQAIGAQVIKIAPDCLDTVHKAVKSGDAQIAMRVLDRVLDMSETKSAPVGREINIAIAQLLPSNQRTLATSSPTISPLQVNSDAPSQVNSVADAPDVIDVPSDRSSTPND